MNKALIKSDCFRVALIGLWSMAFSVILVHSQVTFNPTVEVTLGGSPPGSVIGAGTMPQIVRTTTFFFNLRDDLPSSRTMTFDTGVLNINAITLGSRLFETNMVIKTAIFGDVGTARVGHTVVSLDQDSVTLVGTVEATTIDPAVTFFLGDEVIPIIQALIGSVGMTGSISANAQGFSYTDSFNVPNDTISEDLQSVQIQAVVTDTFPADLYTTPQLAGTLIVSNQLTSLIGLTSGPIIDQFTVSESAPSETPSTVLVAIFLNGNNSFLNSRVYLWNPSDDAGDITARVYTLPLSGPSTLLGTVSLGLLNARSARNIKIAESILALLIPLPYTNDGGNLTLEFTIGAENTRGVAQVFSDSLAFGTYPLQEILSTSTGNATVLVANFTNGNNAFFNSRVYLWNPSQSAGSVTVRAYTLPSSGPSILLGTAEVGLLEARSALNIKIAEDVLSALGIPLPYTDDGGNLTIEVTIGAENVRGVAQVFSSDLAFGTYPLQQIAFPAPTISNLTGSAQILFPSNGATFSGSPILPIVGSVFAEFDFEAASEEGIEALATLSIPTTTIGTCTASPSPTQLKAVYQVGQVIGTVSGKATVLNEEARVGIIPDPCQPGSLIDVAVSPENVAIISYMPLPNGANLGDGTAEFLFEAGFNGLSGHVTFPPSEFVQNPDPSLGLDPGFVFFRYQIFPPGTYNISLTVTVGETSVATATSSFTVTEP